MGFGVETTGEASEFAGRANHPMTWNNNRNGITRIRGTYGPAG